MENLVNLKTNKIFQNSRRKENVKIHLELVVLILRKTLGGPAFQSGDDTESAADSLVTIGPAGRHKTGL